MSVYTISVAGESQKNDDGESRQSIIKTMLRGEVVELIHQPDNPYDENAVAIFNSFRKLIGYVPRQKAGWVSERIDRGSKCVALVRDIIPPEGERPYYAVVLIVAFDEEQPIQAIVEDCGFGEEEVLDFVKGIELSMLTYESRNF